MYNVKRSALDEQPAQLGQKRAEGLVVEMLDQVGGDGLVERSVGERQRPHVGEHELQLRKERARPRDRARLGVDADHVAAETGEEVRHRAGRTAEVDDAVAGARLDELLDGGEPELGPRRPLEIRGRHAIHELVVVLGGRSAEREPAHPVTHGWRRWCRVVTG